MRIRKERAVKQEIPCTCQMGSGWNYVIEQDGARDDLGKELMADEDEEAWPHENGKERKRWGCWNNAHGRWFQQESQLFEYRSLHPKPHVSIFICSFLIYIEAFALLTYVLMTSDQLYYVSKGSTFFGLRHVEAANYFFFLIRLLLEGKFLSSHFSLFYLFYFKFSFYSLEPLASNSCVTH